MSRRHSTPPKRRLSLSDGEPQEKRQRSTDGEAKEAHNHRRAHHTPPTRDESPNRTNDRRSHRRRSPSHSDEVSLSPVSSSESGPSSHHAGSTQSLGARPTWRTDSAATWSSERPQPYKHRSYTANGDEDRKRGRTGSPSAMRATSQPESGATQRSYFTSNGTAAPAPNKQAAFVNKLYQMLEDPRIVQSGLLEWAKDGKSFICNNPAEFARDVLPNFFKHNNWQSFVRQLNMYSFNKVSDLYSTANVDPTAWEFRHPLFQRGKPELLPRIKRKSNRHAQQGSATPSPGEDDMRQQMSWSAAVRPMSSHRPVVPNGGYLGPVAEDDGHPVYHIHPQSRPVSSGYGSTMSVSESPMSHPAYFTRARSRSGAQVPVMAASNVNGRGISPALSEPTYYTTARPANMDTLSNQITTLQDTVHKLWATLNHERQANARTNLDLSGYLLRMTGWLLASDGHPIPRDLLERQREDLLQRYETLRESELLSNAPAASEEGGQYASQRTFQRPPPPSASMYPQTADPDVFRPVVEEPPTAPVYQRRSHNQASAYGDAHYRVAEGAPGRAYDRQHLPREVAYAPPPHDAHYVAADRMRGPSHSRHPHDQVVLSTGREHYRPPQGADDPHKNSLRSLLH